MYFVVGGLAHSLAGPIIGALIPTFISEYFRIAKEYEPIITSVLIVFIIIFMPMGILGLIDSRVKPFFLRKWHARFNNRTKSKEKVTL